MTALTPQFVLLTPSLHGGSPLNLRRLGFRYGVASVPVF